MRYQNLINTSTNPIEPIAEADYIPIQIEHINICFACSKKLRNFTVNLDWKERQYHKSCFKRRHQFEIMMDSYRNGVGKSSADVLIEKYVL